MPTAGDLNRSIAIGAMWSHGSLLAGKVIVFVNTIVLARLLTAADFGLVAIGLTLLTILDMIAQAGVGAAVVWRKGDPGETAAAALTLSLVAGAAAAVATYALAPAAADFFNQPAAADYIRVLSVTYLLSSPTTVFAGLLQRRMDFARRAVPELVKAVFRGAVGISLAVLGFGAWSLVAAHLGGVALGLVLSIWLAGWKPRLSADTAVMREILPYGIGIAAIGLIGALTKSIDTVIVAYRFDITALGHYVVAFTLVDQIVMAICWAASQSLFPALSRSAGAAADLRRVWKDGLRGVAMVTFPASVGLALVAEPMLLALYGPQWGDAARPLQILAIYALVYSVGFNMGDIYKAVGRPRTLVLICVITFPVAVPVLLLGAEWGIEGVAAAQIVVAAFLVALNVFIAKRVVGIGWTDLAEALRSPALAAVAMTGLCLLFDELFAGLPPVPRLVGLVVVGAGGYTGALWLLAPDLIVGALRLLRPAARSGGAASS